VPLDGLAFMAPEEIEALKARIARAKREFTDVYGLKWTFPPQAPRRALVHIDDLRADVRDHGPLSYWRIEQQHAQGAGWRTLEGDEVVAFEVGIVEAMEALCKVLDARAEAAAEALRDEPLSGFTSIPGPVGIWGAQPAPAPAAPVMGFTTMPAPAPAPPAPASPAPASPAPASPTPAPTGSKVVP
jgi:hypothetical protein